MANEKRGSIADALQRNIVPVAIVVVVILLFIPLPKILIDLLMIVNLAFSFIILLAVINTPRASDFQTFPRIILFQTVFGIGINISSTRLILLNKASASGVSSEQSAMVQAFANIVCGDNIVIGFIIFIILVIVQVLVITKGAGRVSEVAARFSLDSMSQKFFDVDNRLNSGAIDDQEAMRLKDAIRREIDFYSNMDGASKFVSGNVKFGIVVTVVNLIGGFIMGMVYNNMNFSDALQVYSILTIGDGLISQLPSLIISFATGLLVTGTKSDETFDEQLKSDFTRSGYIYVIVGVVLAVSGLILRTGTQFLLIPLGALFVFIGLKLSKQKEKELALIQSEKNKPKEVKKSEDDEKIIMLDPLSLEIGYALIPLVQKEKGAELLERITRIRNQSRLDMGFDIPQIRIRDDMTLDPNDYSFKIEGIEAGHANIKVGYVMCMDTGTVVNPLQGEVTKDPAFGMSAIWLPESQRAEAEEAGYIVADAPTVIATHITEIIKANAAKMLDRQSVSVIIDKVKEKYPVLVNEVLETAKVSYGTIEKVLKNLLAEKVSIRNYTKILETLANYANVSQNVWDLTAKVREALGLQICMQYVDPNEKKLRVIRLSQELSELIANHAVYPPDGSEPYVALDPVDRRKWLSAVDKCMQNVQQMGMLPIIICVSQVRQLVHQSLEREMPGVVVLSEMEVYSAGNSIGVEIISELSEVSEVSEDEV
ncbi:MAG: FHIPEP family type III secretion protein [Treponema sp.]|nr:FHIPEP family type III secretion protein [Treponema sp.]